MHRQTQKALGVRAKTTADMLDYWVKELLGEMEKQNIQMWNEDGSEPNDTPMTITVGTMRRLIRTMRTNLAEIRKFSN
jgi:hypothetical protein